jgi:hypothetical protein
MKMKKAMLLLSVICLCMGCASGPSGGAANSLYVSAKGDNGNDGLSKRKPLRSLALAYEKACAGSVKTITVIGTLNHQSEAGDNEDAVFYLRAPEGVQNDGEILITGITDAKKDLAVLSGAGSKKSVVKVTVGPVRFEHIEISGGELNDEKKGGSGIDFSAAGIISTGAVVRDNKGAGIRISTSLSGDVTLAGGIVQGNEGSGVNGFGDFTMQRGEIKNNKAEDGAGVRMLSGAFTLSGGTITGNTAADNGGGVYITMLGTFTMTGGTISGNTATKNGGGVYLMPISQEEVTAIKGGTITNNKAENGGGVYVNGGEFRMSGGSFSGNTVTGNGGGIYITNGLVGSGVFTLADGNITNNKAKNGGGVLFNGEKFTMTGGTISGNTATGGGGGVFENRGEFTMSGGAISGNTATEHGGGITSFGVFTLANGNIANNKAKSGGGVIFHSEKFTMSGGTISGNTATEDGGGLYVDEGEACVMSGGTISGNTATGFGGGVFISINEKEKTNVFTMSNGSIARNKAQSWGGGVYVAGPKDESAQKYNGGVFRQSGGSVTANSARVGGGVLVRSFGRYDKTGGSVSGNTTTHTSSNAMEGSDDNINREKGSLGSGR